MLHSGVVDGYQESLFIDDPISTRLNGFVDLDDSYEVIKRDLTVIAVINSVFGRDSEYFGNYTTTNAGFIIKHFDGIFDDGAANASGLNIVSLDTYFPSLTIRDFTERAFSQYTLAGDKFNLLPPSIQDPVTISRSSGAISNTIDVDSTAYFPTSGYLFSAGGTVIQYTGKTATTFTGCSVYNGPTTIGNGDDIIPFSIS